MSPISPAEGSTPAPPTDVRRQLMWTALLALMSLGGAGLASAADRAPTEVARPELTWRAEQAGRPMLDAMAEQLRSLDEALATLSGAGRDTLLSLRSLDAERIEGAVVQGDAASARVQERVTALADLRARQRDEVDDRRLGDASRQLLSGIDAAVAETAPLERTWAGMAADARLVARLLDALGRHDELVFEATGSGRAADYEAALELLSQAELALAEAGAVRDQISAGSDVETLDELVRRYRNYDGALDALYREILRSGSQDSDAVRERIAAVDRAQQALPASNDALQIVVTDAASSSIADGLLAIEEARGVVADVVAGAP